MIEPEKPFKKKDQIKFDKEVVKRLAEVLDVELEEEERVARQREDEANLISWDNTQAMMEADCELAQRLQAEEQGELTIVERLRTLHQEFLKALLCLIKGFIRLLLKVVDLLHFLRSSTRRVVFVQKLSFKIFLSFD
ncbi:hypothetical protein Tco_0172973 [Tanacetum coccineum]